jgi:hypothetical protein
MSVCFSRCSDGFLFHIMLYGYVICTGYCTVCCYHCTTAVSMQCLKWCKTYWPNDIIVCCVCPLLCLTESHQQYYLQRMINVLWLPLCLVMHFSQPNSLFQTGLTYFTWNVRLGSICFICCFWCVVKTIPCLILCHNAQMYLFAELWWTGLANVVNPWCRWIDLCTM